MTLKQIELEFKETLLQHYDAGESQAIFNMVAFSILGYGKSQVMMAQNYEIDDDKRVLFEHMLIDLAQGRPVQYVTGHASFFGLTFKVAEGVLIPRPETEELVDWIIESRRTCTSKSLLDVGTGSGCIAIALKQKLPEMEVTALDVSTEALAIAKENSGIHQTPITFIHGDILKFSGESSYDIIVSNPPYITDNEAKDMHENVLKHEPHLALFVPDNDPLIFYTAIAEFAVSNLAGNGLLFFEINANLGKEMIQMLQAKGFTDIVLRKDMQGMERMIRCRKSVSFSDESPL